MNAELYAEWKADPRTLLYMQFLRDYRQSLMEKWANGALQDKEALLAMGRCQLADDLAGLDDDFISEFYRQTKKGSDDVPEDKGVG
jgi:hypothetical protein